MIKQLERVLPILTTIPVVNIPATFLQGVYIAASQRRIEQLEGALRHEIKLLNRRIDAGKVSMSKEYVHSEAFPANVMQALRAVEVAESAEKMAYIARALVNCVLDFGDLKINKNICMRILEQITVEEIDFLMGILNDPRITRVPQGVKSEGAFVETDGMGYLSNGLLQLGLLSISTSRIATSPSLRPSILAEHLAALCLNEIEP